MSLIKKFYGNRYLKIFPTHQYNFGFEVVKNKWDMSRIKFAMCLLAFSW